MKELVLWTLPQGETDPLYEQPIASHCRTLADVERVKQVASKDGWHTFRVQVLDGTLPDFTQTLNT